MNNNEWITDRRPTEEDAVFLSVWVWSNGELSYRTYDKVDKGQPWRRITVPEPYVKPKRYEVVLYQGDWCIRETNCIGYFVAFRIGTIEAAERIAAIYEEVMP